MSDVAGWMMHEEDEVIVGCRCRFTCLRRPCCAFNSTKKWLWVPTDDAHVHFLCCWLTNITDNSRGYKKRFLSFIAISIQLEFGHSLYKNNRFTITWEIKARAFTVELLHFGKTFFTKGVVKPRDQIYKSWKSKTINIYKYLFFYKACSHNILYYCTSGLCVLNLWKKKKKFSHYVHSWQLCFIQVVSWQCANSGRGCQLYRTNLPQSPDRVIGSHHSGGNQISNFHIKKV